MALFLNWNVNGLRSRLPELKLLISTLNPICCTFQETNLTPIDDPQIRNHILYRRDRTATQHASGGVCVCVRRTVFSEVVPLVTPLEAVAVSVRFPDRITVCSLYLPPGLHVDRREIDTLLRQLPAPYIVCGDFNAYNPLWGSPRFDTRGRLLEQIFSEANLIILNNDHPTHFNAVNGTFSHLDLSVCTSTISHALN